MSTILNNLLKSFESRKDNPFLRYGIAIEYRNLGNLEKALEYFSGVHELFPEYLPNYYHFAQALYSSEETNNAKKICQEGLLLAEKLGEAHAASELRRLQDELI